MRKALIVGINEYASIGKLYGCANDARGVYDVLSRHQDGSKNFDCKLLIAEEGSAVTRRTLRESVTDLFSFDDEIALFYFAGHGYIDSTGGFLCSTDSETGDDGLSLNEITKLANKCRARNRIIILDSCHSGIAGNPTQDDLAEVADGVTVMTASGADEYATEKNGHGVFTALLVNALNGAASNLVGEISPGSVYAHIDQSLGTWGARPVFKTNVKRFVSLRTVNPPIPREDLRRLATLFPRKGFEYPLDPSFEPHREIEYKSASPEIPEPDPENTEIFSVLQKYNRVGLAVPVDAPHMWHAAMGSHGVRLTPLGEHYRRLCESGQL